MEPKIKQETEPKQGVIVYKGVEFVVRKNALGVSQKLQEMMRDYNYKQEYLNEAPFLNEPELEMIMNLEKNVQNITEDYIRNINRLSDAQKNNLENDLSRFRELESKKKLTDSEKKEFAKLNYLEIISANAKHLDDALENLNNPEKASVKKMKKMLDYDKAIYNISYKQDPAHIRALAEAYLMGDLSQINFDDTNDSDYWKLAGELWQQFFFTLTLAHTAPMRY